MKTKLYQLLASLVQARINCENSGNQEWFGKHTERILGFVDDHMPSGSGIDCGTEIDLDESHAEKLVFTFSYHHMDDGGGYCGWTDHKCVVKPSLASGFTLNITGRDKKGVKDYLHEVFHTALSFEIQA